MKVRELREAIKGLPDDAEVMGIAAGDGRQVLGDFEEVGVSIDGTRVYVVIDTGEDDDE